MGVGNQRAGRSGVWLAVKLGATAVWCGFALFVWIPRAVDRATVLLTLNFWILPVLHLTNAALCIVAILGAGFIRNAWIRTALVVPFVIFFGFSLATQRVQGVHLTSDMVATFIQSRHEIGHALGTFSRDILLVCALVVFLVVGLVAPVPRRLSGLRPGFVAVPLAAFAMTWWLIGSFPGRLEELPSPIALPVQVLVGARETTRLYLGARDPLIYDHAVAPRNQKVVLIIDESVRGDYLQLNNPQLDNTPYLMRAQPLLANFGLATAYSNCSATARVALRSGARDTDIPDPDMRVLHQPTFWQFAKRAGYRTVFLDAWWPVRAMTSMVTHDELADVDARLEVPLAPYWEADDRIADEIIRELARPGPAFMFVEKIGLHSPYSRNLPPEALYMPRMTAFAARQLDPASAETVRQYVTGVRWRVDRFFERLLPALEGRDDVLLIYTSDHGQALYDGGYESTNCSGTNAVKGEGLVPLFVYAGEPAERHVFQAAAARSRDKAAHSDIFPTLLAAMGFAPDRVSPPYSAGLLQVPTKRSRRFFVLSPFRVDVSWISVD